MKISIKIKYTSFHCQRKSIWLCCNLRSGNDIGAEDGVCKNRRVRHNNREDELGREFRQMLAREETVSVWQIIQQHRASNFEEQWKNCSKHLISKKNLFSLNYNASLQTWAFEFSNHVNIIKEYWNNKLFYINISERVLYKIINRHLFI